MKQAASGRLGKSDARVRIMEATRALAAERGAGNISIEAVAARAGLSKGGVLYHFRTKADLLKALVANHVERSRCRIEDRLGCFGTCSNAFAEALVEAHRQDESGPVPASGVLAAIAENPDLLDPLHAHHDEMLAHLRGSPGDPELATIVFLALEGMKAMHLFGFDVLDQKQEDLVLDRMKSLLRKADQTP